MKQQISEQFGEQPLGDKEVREMISMRAYEIHLSRGGEHGGDVEDWLQAEREVLASLSGEAPLTEGSDNAQLVTTVTEATESETPGVKKPKSSAAPRTRKE
jgi:Protein of unknown function (DUF2934)